MVFSNMWALLITVSMMSTVIERLVSLMKWGMV